MSPQAAAGVFCVKLVPGTAGTAMVRNLCRRWRAGGRQMFWCCWPGIFIPCPHRWSFGAPWQLLPPHTPSHLLALTDPTEEWLSSGESRTKRSSSTSGCETRQSCVQCIARKPTMRACSKAGAFHPESILVIHQIVAWMELQGIFF